MVPLPAPRVPVMPTTRPHPRAQLAAVAAAPGPWGVSGEGGRGLPLSPSFAAKASKPLRGYHQNIAWHRLECIEAPGPGC